LREEKQRQVDELAREFSRFLMSKRSEDPWEGLAFENAFNRTGGGKTRW
jgi:hypothetical protein